MDTVTISDARQFSLQGVQKNDLLHSDSLHIQLFCFEAGQRDEEVRSEKPRVYQGLEGEALVRGRENSDGKSEASVRLGKGKLLHVPANTAHTLENAGGGLLVLLATRAL